jgi:hypothetical protein
MTPNDEPYFYNLYSITGELMKYKSDLSITGFNKIKINIGDISEGLYMLTLQNKNKFFGVKIILK